MKAPDREQAFVVEVDGQLVAAHDGQTIAATLMAADAVTFVPSSNEVETMKNRYRRRHVIAIGLALALGWLLTLGLVAGLGKLDPPGAAAGDGARSVVGQSSALAATGSITGLTQVDDSGEPVAGVVVTVYDGVSFALLYTTTTDANGHYVATVTAPYSQARLEFDGGPVGYSRQWYRDKPFFSQSDRVNIREGTAVTDVSVLLSRRGIISGTVTLDGGGPAADVSVLVCDTVLCTAQSQTDHDGRFIIVGLMSGTYRLLFSGGAFPGIVYEYYRNRYELAAADPIAVTAGAASVITAQVSSRNVITGIVTDETYGVPVNDAKVVLYTSTTEVVRDMHTPCLTCGPGEYRFYDLDAGQYRLEFAHPPYHVTEFYNNQHTLTDAISVSVAAGQVITGVNAALATGPTGTLVLTLTQNGQPLSFTHEVRVELYDAMSRSMLATLGTIRGDGSTTVYVFPVPGGDYLVYLGTNYPLLGEWYDGQSSSTTANVVTVEVGATVVISVDLAAVLTSTGCIAGHVTSGGLPLQGAYVRAYRVGDNSGFAESAQADAAGAYGPLCVPPGDYEVSFSYFPFMTTWYSGTVARSEAAIVSVISDTTLANIDGVLNDLGGCISGRIVDANQDAVQGAFILEDASGGSTPFWHGSYGSFLANNKAVSWPDSDRDGGFVACGLASGSFVVRCPAVRGNARVQVTAPRETSGVVCKALSVYLPFVVQDAAP